MARLLAVVISVSALLATTGFAVQPDPDCFQYTSCMTCTEAPSGKCGWDAASASCKPGAAGGPSGSSASYTSSEAWWWTSAKCCESRTGQSCTDCVFDTDGYCGWDVNHQKCQPGSTQGPTIGYSASWVSTYTGCPSQCQMNVDCSSCVSQQGCGWLANIEQCVAGSASGAFYGQPVVEDNYFLGQAWWFSSCPSNWRLRWSANSYSLWCVVGGVGALLLGASVVAGRRRRRIIRQQRSQMAAFAAQAQPTVGAPLLAQAADTQPAYTAQPIYGQPAPMPYYGATPEDGSCNAEVKP